MIPLGVSAASVGTSISCPSSANANSLVSCSIRVNPNGFLLGGFQAKFTIAGGSYDSFSASSGWTVYSSSASGISITSNNTYSSSTTVGNVKLKMPSNGNMVIKLSDIAASDDNYNSYDGSNTSATIRVKSNVNTLSNLSVSGISLSPSFSSNVTNYSASTDNSSITINATKSDSNSSVSGAGLKNLNYGKNTFNIVVKAEDGSTKTYVIVINRNDNRNGDSTLKSLSVSGGQIKFSSSVKNYNISLGSNVDKFSVNGVANNSKSKVSYSPSSSINLKQGETKSIIVTVTAENQSKTEYKINVSRADSRSNDNYLKSLSVSEIKFSFNRDLLNYSLSVPFNISKLNLSYIVNDTKAKVDVKGNTDLVVGKNVISLLVTAENETTRTYTLNVNRLNENETTTTTTTTTKASINKLNNDSSDNSKLLFFILGFVTGVLLTLIVLFIIRKTRDKKSALNDVE